MIKILDGAYLFGNLPFRRKFTALGIVSILIVIGMSFKEVWSPNYGQGKNTFQGSPRVTNGSIENKKGSRVFTVQIAAVTSAKQANKLVERLKRKNIENLYITKSKRRSGGLWYKLRVGKFSSKKTASEFANQLIASKKVKNYFIISILNKQFNSIDYNSNRNTAIISTPKRDNAKSTTVITALLNFNICS